MPQKPKNIIPIVDEIFKYRVLNVLLVSAVWIDQKHAMINPIAPKNNSASFFLLSWIMISFTIIFINKIELQENLILRQAEITEIDRDEDGTWKLTTRMDAIFTAKAVVIATGTYLGGRIFVGETSYESGPDGIFPAKFLGASLKNLGLKKSIHQKNL